MSYAKLREFFPSDQQQSLAAFHPSRQPGRRGHEHLPLLCPPGCETLESQARRQDHWHREHIEPVGEALPILPPLVRRREPGSRQSWIREQTRLGRLVQPQAAPGIVTDHYYWVECSRSIKLTALLSNSPIKITALLFIRAVIITGLFIFWKINFLVC